jgi:hypothetical protein
MTGARDIARVLDARLRRRLDGIQPQPPGPWSARVPDTGSPDLNRYLRELAAAMDGRARRLGEHTAQTQPAWARQALGPVPGDPAARADWEHRAGLIAAYRERYGHAHPADPIGPVPGTTSPEARAAWHTALSALGRVDGIDLRACTDGELWLRRSVYERETAWAPPHVAEELRLMRIAQRDAHVNAVRAAHEARAARDDSTAARHHQLVGIWQALEAKAAREVDMFAAAQDTRRRWEALTETTRRIAIAADIELRRRHPGAKIEPLRSHPAEADHLSASAPDHQDPEAWIQLTLDGSAHFVSDAKDTEEQHDAAPGQRSPEGIQLALGLTPETAHAEIPEQVQRIHENARLTQARLDDLAHTPMPAETESDRSSGLAWPAQPGPERAAVLQPPQPEIVPAAGVAEIYHDLTHDQARAEPEAG